MVPSLPSFVAALSLALSFAASIPAAHAQRATATAPWQPARFADTARLTKISSAFAEIDRRFSQFATQQHIPGAAWGIIVDGRLVHVGVTGFRDLATKSRVDSQSVFRIASMTKSFTALAILKLRDDGKLSLDDPAERYVPELAGLKYPTTDSPKITIRHLLSHSEGFPEDNPWGDQQLAVTDEQMSEMMRRGIPFSNPPGVAYEYSNYGFAILGRIITRASGVPYDQYISRNILRPLGMNATTLEPASVPRTRLAQGYRWEDEQWKLEPQLPDGAFGAMGGMLTSLNDLGLYVGALMGAWPPRDGPETGPVRRASMREMQQVARTLTPTVTRDSTGVRLTAGGYGYGLRVASTCMFSHVVSHSGGLPGFGSQMRWLPEHGVGIIAFGNRTYTGWNRPFEDALNILAATGGLQARAPQPSVVLTSAREAVTRLILNWNDALADSIAANNLFLDRSRDRRRVEFAALKTRLGQCSAAARFDSVENALRGEWVMPCERGALRVSITLAPTSSPLVQHLEAKIAEGTASTRSRICTVD